MLLAVSFVWLQLLPRRGLTDTNKPRESAAGPISRVIIDAGHGGKDSGAIQSGISEKDLTLDVALRVDRLVRAQGLTTKLTRSGDEAVSLANRAALANRERDCVFISIHFDEGGRAAATGVQTFYAAHQAERTRLLPTWLPFLQRVSSAPANLESQSLAELVQDAIVHRTQALNRGTRAEQFYVVTNVQHPAVLVEGGFLSNNDDIAKLTTESYREQLAIAISEGVIRYREITAEQQLSGAAGQP